MARKLSKNQTKAKAKTSNKKTKTQVTEVESQNEELPVDSVIVNETAQPTVAKPARKSSKKAAIANHETKEELMKRVSRELIKTLITAGVSMAAGIILAEFITLH